MLKIEKVLFQGKEVLTTWNNGLVGLKEVNTGKEILPHVYSFIAVVDDDRIVVIEHDKKHNKRSDIYTVLDEKFQPVGEPYYDIQGRFVDGLMIVALYDPSGVDPRDVEHIIRYVYINKAGEVDSPIFMELQSFDENGFAKAQTIDGIHCVINQKYEMFFNK